MTFMMIPALISEVDTNIIKDGAVTNPKLATDAVTTIKVADEEITFAKIGADVKKWELLETLNPTGVAGITSGTLDAKQKYKVCLRLRGQTNPVSLQLRFNGDTANNYNTLYIDDTTTTKGNNVGSIMIGTIHPDREVFGELLINGLSHGTGSENPHLMSITHIGYTGQNIGLMGSWESDSQISTITFVCSEQITGVIEIYGSD